MFYEAVANSAIMFAVVCMGSRMEEVDFNRQQGHQESGCWGEARPSWDWLRGGCCGSFAASWKTPHILYACYWCSTGALRPSKTKHHRRPPVFTAHFNHQCFFSFLHWLLFTIIQHTSPYLIALHFWVLHLYIQFVLFSYLCIKYSDSDINLPSMYR